MGAPQVFPAITVAPSTRSKPSTSWKSVVDESVTSYEPVVDLVNGEASVSVPEEIYENAKPLWRNFVLGHFIGTAPHIGKVHAIVNKIWIQDGSKSKIDVQYLNSTAILFRVDDDFMRSKMLKSAYWHIAEVPLVVYEWCPENVHRQLDLTSIPLWVDMKDVPGYLFSVKGLSFIASTLGKPLKLHPTTKNCTRLDSARVLVEVDLTKPLHSVVHVNGKLGAVHTIQVTYPWVPPRCSLCSKWGHNQKQCSQAVSIVPVATSESAALSTIISTPSVPSPPALPTEVETHATVQMNASITTASASSALPQPENQSQWKMIPVLSRSKSPSPNKTSANVSPSISPSRFAPLSDLPEEGEIQEIEEDAEDDSDPVLSQDQDFPALSVAKNHGPPRNRNNKQSKKPILNKKDMILASTQSNTNKRASSRKH